MPEKQPIRLIIADDQALVRAGLKSYLHGHSQFRLVGEAETGDDAIQLCEMLNPDVIILDGHMPGVDGFFAARVIHQRLPQITILLLIDTLDETAVRTALESGADGCLSKNIRAEELVSALDQKAGKTVGKAAKHTPAPGTRQDGKHGKREETRPRTTIFGPGLTEQRTTIELEMAGKIQATILPENAPWVEGWDISATIQPAYETSGDFYDFIPLAYGKIGIVIGDVANKGLGAAIFMSLCCSLIRTYATHFPIMPGMMVHAVNERLNADTRSGMFVTVFYGVLDPKLNRLIYVNAGHNPPILVSNNKGKPVDLLGTTGPALGILENTSWQQKLVKFSPGDILLMYTDGVTEATNPSGDFFGEQRLLNLVRGQKGHPAKKIQQAVLNSVKRFTNGAPLQDDIALITLNRPE